MATNVDTKATAAAAAMGVVRSSVTLQLEQKLKFFDRHVAGGPSVHLNVLEIGCGSEPHLAIALHARGHHVTGIDPWLSEASIKAAGENLRLVKADFIEWDHEQHLKKHQHQYFDVVMFTKSLHHIPDVDNALVKAWSLVKPENGHLLIEEFARETINEVTATWYYGTFDAFRAAGFTKRKMYDPDGSAHHHHHGSSHHEHHHQHQHSGPGTESGHHHQHHHSHHRADDESNESLPPLERWKMDHVHNPPLHTGSRIREGVKRLLMDMGGGKEEEERVPFLFNCFVDMFEDLKGVDKQPNGYNVVNKIMQLEQDLIAKQVIVPVGINFSVKRHGIH